MSKISIVSDSTCDLPVEWLTKYNIHLTYAYVNFGIDESYRDDGQAITKEQFYKRLPDADPLPKTAAPSPGEAEEVLRAALEDADHVIAIHLNKNLSAIYDATRIAAEKIGRDRVTLIDTGTLSMGLGWLVMVAAEAVAAGDDVETVVKKIYDAKERTMLWAVPSTMEFLRKSGRVSTLVAGLGEMLQIKPIIRAAGHEVESEGRVRTFKKVIPKLVDMAEELSPIERLAILHMDNPTAADELMEAMKARGLVPENSISVMVTPAIGVNFGPAGLGLAFISKPK